MNKVIGLALGAMVTAALYGCGGSSSSSTTPTPTPGPTPPAGNELGIAEMPKALQSTYSKALKFDRYTKVDTPNGGAIHIVAQDALTDNQIVRARSVLEHYLTNFPGSQYGADKSAVANKMADNGAVLMLLNGVDDGTNPAAAAEIEGQPLFAGEIQVEGHAWYIQQDYEHRDATFEEILHLVHDYGIGVDQNPEFIGALADYQAHIRAAQENALTDKEWAWRADSADWVAELTAENSLSQEYLAAVIDSYYGLWGAYESEYGMWGEYIAKTRADIDSKDADGGALVPQFFHPYLTYTARIDDSFEGDFSLKFNAALGYTYHAQYLKDLRLTGSKSSNVIVNGRDNHIWGNTGTNKVLFSGPSSEYEVSKNGKEVSVKDMVDGRDGNNTLVDIESLVFSDTTVAVNSL